MRAIQKAIVVGCGLAIGLAVGPNPIEAQSDLESPSFSNPNLLAAIFMPSKQVRTVDEPVDLYDTGFARTRQEFRINTQRQKIPANWEEFEKIYGPASHPGQPTLRFMEKGMYEINQTLYSLKLFERKVNSLLNLEWTMSELAGYDPKSKANELDNFFDHARAKSDFEWDAPIGLYVGVRFQIKCNSIFQFWK